MVIQAETLAGSGRQDIFMNVRVYGDRKFWRWIAAPAGSAPLRSRLCNKKLAAL